MSLKQILIILIIILILVISGFLAYNFYFKDQTSPTDDPSGGQIPSADQATDSTSGSSLQGRVIPLSQEPALNPFTDGQTVKYYSQSNGNVFESDLDSPGSTGSNRISSVVLSNLIKALWSPDGNKVIAIFDENGLAKKYLYDYNTKISTPLDSKIRWLTWSPNQERVAYQYYDSQTEDNNISVANPDGSDWTSVFQTRIKDLIVEWPDSSKLAIRTKPSGLAQSIVYTIDLASKDFEKIINETYGLTLLWSPLGNKILYSETDNQGKNLKLKVLDLEKQTMSELNLVTLPEKCVWSQDNRTIFCAVPKSIPSEAVLPDDYYKKKITFNDDFYQINLETEQITRIFEAQGIEKASYNAKELLLPPLENYILFINQKDGFLYSLAL